MRSLATIAGLLLLILTQSGLTYTVTTAICSTSIPGAPKRHCCMGDHKATSSSNQCREMCQMESKDIPVTPRTEKTKVYFQETALSLVLVNTHAMWLPVEQKQWSVSLEFSSSDSRVEVYLLKTSFLI